MLALLATAGWTIVGVDWPSKTGRGNPVDALIASVHGNGESAIQANIEATDRAVDLIDSLQLIRDHGNSRRRTEAKQGLALLRVALDEPSATRNVEAPVDPYFLYSIQVIKVLQSVAKDGTDRQQQQARMSLERIRKHLG
ncbi:MAG: hypothetical protein ACE37K_11105 [Planctomycetota bacterium]